MTNEELKKAIIAILNKNFTGEWVVTPVYTTNDGKEIELPQELCEIFNDIVVQAVIPYFADALIAAGIGDVKEAEHRAEVAERALKRIAHYFANCRDYYFLKNEREKERYEKAIFEDWINQAKEELAEEGKE